MKKVVLIACTVAILAILSGCRSTGPYGGAGVRSPTIPDYPKLTRTFDTSARFSVYGLNGKQRNGLIQELRQAGYTDADARPPDAVGQIVAPDWIIDIVSANEYKEALIWQRCDLTVRVRKPMKTAPGGMPVVDEGNTFEASAHTFTEACANLMNVEAFRLALELK